MGTGEKAHSLGALRPSLACSHALMGAEALLPETAPHIQARACSHLTFTGWRGGGGLEGAQADRGGTCVGADHLERGARRRSAGIPPALELPARCPSDLPTALRPPPVTHFPSSQWRGRLSPSPHPWRQSGEGLGREGAGPELND